MPWRKIKGAQWGWFREYQRRGVVHYHVILAKGLLAQAFGVGALVTRDVGRGKGLRTVVSGGIESHIVNRWCHVVGDTSPEFEAFQWGGIVELMRHANSPGRYLGAYASKASQKKLPDGEAIGGRWWWLAPSVKIVPRGTFVLWDWPLEYPSTVLWDFKILDPNLNFGLAQEAPK
jgi:hypothetical protein